ncbi:hypothetical protein [Pseudaestuariivita atlantica]|uniref:hypothetical protein n=1 Tax=Pseudaestuariivita atlantica TaxID=1317121 RepID=UPI0013F4AD4C|nr:hypothetical protein [Pseudaestuariivita atlantica]
MDIPYVVPILALLTLLGVTVLAIRSQQKVQHRMDSDKARKSTLAADKASDGTPADA